jgi:WD40 repeat protein
VGEGKGACPHCGAKFKFNAKSASPPVDPKPPAVPDDMEGYGLAEEDVPTPKVVPAASRAPEAAPRPAERRRPRERRKPTAPSRVGLGMAVGAGGALLLIAILGAVWIWRGGRHGAPVEPGAPPAPRVRGELVVRDRPVPGIQAEASAKVRPFFVAAPRPESRAIGEPPPAPSNPSTGSAPAATDATAAPRWDVPADPRPADAPRDRYADGLYFPVEACTVEFNLWLAPVLADRDGPFALLPPSWPESPYRLDSKLVRSVRTTYIAEKAQPPIAVADLLTGEKAGEFSWRSPFWRDPRLSPKATYLVGPDSRPYWLNNDRASNLVPNIERDALYVWTREADKPARKLSVKGVTHWAGFVDDERLALYVAGEAAVLQVWDVAAGKMAMEVPLSIGTFAAPRFDPNRWNYQPWPGLGALSPGGRYLALGGPSGIAFVSLGEKREVGTIPITLDGNQDRREYQGLAFSPDGAKLLGAFSSSPVKSTLRAWSATTGAPLPQAPLPYGVRLSGALVAGPEPETLLGPGYPVLGDQPVPIVPAPQPTAQLIDGESGRVLASHPPILRWPDSGPILALAQLKDVPPGPRPPPAGLGPDRVVAYTAEAARARFHDAAGKTEFGAERRPRARDGDRTAVKTEAARPPEAWSAPPTPKVDRPHETAVLPDWPSSFAGGQAAVIRLEPAKAKAGTTEFKVHAMHWDRLDTRTGKEAGKSVALWPWARNPLKPMAGGEWDPIQSALAPDGGRLALRDPDDPARVDVWEASGSRVVGLYPRGPSGRIAWLGWDPDGRLLTVTDGALEAWDIPSGKAALAVEGEFLPPVDVAPGGAWLAVGTSKGHVDLIDARTGRCLGRCAAGSKGTLADLAIAPGGARLAGVYAARWEAADRFRAGRGLRTLGDEEVELVVWDLKTGRAEAAPLRVRAFALLHWGSDEHVGVFDREGILCDMRGRCPVLAYKFDAAYRWPKEGLPLRRGPDGRLWLGLTEGATTRGWSAMAVPDPKGKDGKFLAQDREFFDAMASPLRVEIDAGPAANGEKHAQGIAAQLQKRGYTIGPGGWRLRIVHEVADSGGSLSFGKANVPLPKVAYTWQLLDPRGAEAWRGTTHGYFLGIGSKYHSRPRPGQAAPVPFDVRVEYYEFGGRDVRTAVVEEILEAGGGLTTVPETLPRRLLRAGGEYLQFPAVAEHPLAKAP